MHKKKLKARGAVAADVSEQDSSKNQFVRKRFWNQSPNFVSLGLKMSIKIALVEKRTK
jgi:hypothetical protein